VAIVLKSGNLKLLELSGPLQACNEIALLLLLQVLRLRYISYRKRFQNMPHVTTRNSNITKANILEPDDIALNNNNLKKKGVSFVSHKIF
jgi:hypothetical protein